jgi:hypothetical protein
MDAEAFDAETDLTTLPPNTLIIGQGGHEHFYRSADGEPAQYTPAIIRGGNKNIRRDFLIGLAENFREQSADISTILRRSWRDGKLDEKYKSPSSFSGGSSAYIAIKSMLERTNNMGGVIKEIIPSASPKKKKNEYLIDPETEVIILENSEKRMEKSHEVESELQDKANNIAEAALDKLGAEYSATGDVVTNNIKAFMVNAMLYYGSQKKLPAFEDIFTANMLQIKRAVGAKNKGRFSNEEARSICRQIYDDFVEQLETDPVK